MITLNKGQYFFFSCGMCSDYSTMGFYEVLEDFDVEKEFEVFKETEEYLSHIEILNDDNIIISDKTKPLFVRWLLSANKIKRVEYREIRMGEYDEIKFKEEKYVEKDIYDLDRWW